MSWKIGNVEIKNKIVLAPMAGISNPAYIKICEEMGLGYAVTELISSEAIIRDSKKTFDMLRGVEKLHIPIAIQIFGSNAEVMAQSAKIITNLYKNVLIDINMGCPVPKVAVRASSGSALLKDPEKVYDIVSKVVKAVSVPVTVKIRSGWDDKSINALKIAKVIEKAGASAITIHPRTRSQGYSGYANWDIIKQIKNAVSIPVIGNGDVTTCYDAKRMLEETGCDAVMIGRGLLGNPWLIRDCVCYLETGRENSKVSVIDKVNMIRKHLEYLLENKPEKVALLEMRSHASWYLKGVDNASVVRTRINKVDNINDFNKVLDTFLKEVINEVK